MKNSIRILMIAAIAITVIIALLEHSHSRAVQTLGSRGIQKPALTVSSPSPQPVGPPLAATIEPPRPTPELIESLVRRHESEGYGIILDDGRAWAANGRQGISAQWSSEPGLLRVESLDPGEAWHFSMRSAGTPDSCSSDRNRLTYHRDTCEEWFINSPKGIEHGFNVPKPLPRDGDGGDSGLGGMLGEALGGGADGDGDSRSTSRTAAGGRSGGGRTGGGLGEVLGQLGGTAGRGGGLDDLLGSILGSDRRR